MSKNYKTTKKYSTTKNKYCYEEFSLSEQLLSSTCSSKIIPDDELLLVKLCVSCCTFSHNVGSDPKRLVVLNAERCLNVGVSLLLVK